jgi:hypothetical protein
MSGKPTDANIPFHVHIINTSSQTVKLLWSQQLNNTPGRWKSYICDKNLCYDTAVISCPYNKPNVIAPGDTMNLELHLLPKGIEGTGEFHVNLVDQDSTPLGNIIGNVIIDLSSSSSQAEKEGKLSVFPNPADDYFRTSDFPGLKSVEVSTILGRKIKSFDAAPRKQYYVGDLSEGIYLVRMINSSGQTLKTIRLSIQ